MEFKNKNKKLEFLQSFPFQPEPAEVVRQEGLPSASKHFRDDFRECSRGQSGQRERPEFLCRKLWTESDGNESAATANEPNEQRKCAG